MTFPPEILREWLGSRNPRAVGVEVGASGQSGKNWVDGKAISPGHALAFARVCGADPLRAAELVLSALGATEAAGVLRATQGAAKSLDGVARLLELVSPEGADLFARGRAEAAQAAQIRSAEALQRETVWRVPRG